MAERDRAAVDVEPIGIDRQLAQARPAPARRTPRSARRDRSDRASARRSFSALRTAGTGPMPKRSGSTPAVAKATKRASGCEAALLRAARPTSRRRPPRRRSSATSCRRSRCRSREMPAAAWRAPRRTCRAAALRPARMSRRESAGAGRSIRATATSNVSGVISSANRPASIAASARWWLRSANASCSSRRDAVLARVVLGDEPGAQIDVRILVDQRRVRATSCCRPSAPGSSTRCRRR